MSCMPSETKAGNTHWRRLQNSWNSSRIERRKASGVHDSFISISGKVSANASYGLNHLGNALANDRRAVDGDTDSTEADIKVLENASALAWTMRWNTQLHHHHHSHPPLQNHMPPLLHPFQPQIRTAYSTSPLGCTKDGFDASAAFLTLQQEASPIVNNRQRNLTPTNFHRERLDIVNGNIDHHRQLCPESTSTRPRIVSGITPAPGNAVRYKRYSLYG
ncbi:hypothetical protein B0O80DRAFT_529217 [Mortierella sp. GBAus27b]|nr:hypothetical protein B0O80DRAFT_529217 [Mortierella sp. GBAus27b]